MRAILTYHSVDPSGSVVSIDEDAFRAHVGFLASGRVRVVGLRELLALPPEEDAVALTFDDGFRNLGRTAWPLLRDHGLPATVFVVTGRVGGENDWDGTGPGGAPRLPLLDWDDLGRLAEEGLELGCHSRSHPHLDRVDDPARRAEVEGAAADIERRTGRRPASFCYPYGSYDEASVRAVRRVYDVACTTRLDVLGPDDDRHRLPRLDVYYYRGRGQLEAWGSPAFRARLATRRLLRAARHRVGRSA